MWEPVVSMSEKKPRFFPRKSNGLTVKHEGRSAYPLHQLYVRVHTHTHTPIRTKKKGKKKRERTSRAFLFPTIPLSSTANHREGEGDLTKGRGGSWKHPGGGKEGRELGFVTQESDHVFFYSVVKKLVRVTMLCM